MITSEYKELLREIEWVSQYYYSSEQMYDVCPCCGSEKSDGHDKQCKLNELLIK